MLTANWWYMQICCAWTCPVTSMPMCCFETSIRHADSPKSDACSVSVHETWDFLQDMCLLEMQFCIECWTCASTVALLQNACSIGLHICHEGCHPSHVYCSVLKQPASRMWCSVLFCGTCRAAVLGHNLQQNMCKIVSSREHMTCRQPQVWCVLG